MEIGRAVLLLASMALATMLACGGVLVAVSSQATAADQRANVVVVMADDLGVDSSDMISGLRAFGASGATFENSFVSNSLCCPSRATFLRGQYSNNHGTLTNWSPEGAYPRFVQLGRDKDNFVTRLNSQGYTTAHYGKYLNKYNGNEHGKPPGWDRFVFVNDGTGGNRYWENGRWGTFAQFHDDYTVQRAANFVASTKGQDAPFYLQVDLHSPHYPYAPPPRYAGDHAGTAIEEKPSFSEDISDKPQWVKDTRAWLNTTDEPARLEATKQNRRKILEETEVAADALARISSALSYAGKARETYVVFTSDNGYQLGEHGLPMYKQPPYEESVRVPLMVRGPGIAGGTVVEQMVVNNDLAPTILDWAGAGVPAYMDGRSITPLAQGYEPTSWREAIMVEHWVDTHQNGDTTPPPIPFYKMARTSSGEVYVEYSTGEREYYDLTKDPYQMDNGAAAPENADRIAELRERLGRLMACSGASCRAAEGPTDSYPPNTTVTSGPPSTTRSTFASFSFGGSETDARFRCSLDGAPSSACVSPKGYAVGNGPHTFRVRAIDAAGNVETDPAIRTWTVDTIKPTVGVLSPKHTSTTRDTTPTIKAAVRDNLTNLQKANIKLYVAGRFIYPTKWSYNASTDVLTYNAPRLSKGKKTVKIVATDAAGNVATKSWYFKIR